MFTCNATNVEILFQHHLIIVIFLKDLIINAIFAILRLINDVNEDYMQLKVISDFEINFLRNHATIIITERM